MTCCSWCCCCSTLRSASYFCTSVQIFAGLYLFLKWVVITFVNGVHNEYFQDSRQQILYPLVLVYISLFILLGCINFIAVQKESGGVIKWTTHLLLVIQLVELCSHFFLGFILPDEDNDLEVHRFFHIQRIFVNFTFSLVYFVILFTYSRALTKGIYIIEESDGSDIKLNKVKKGKEKSKGSLINIEEEIRRPRPSAPPPTPGPSIHNQDDDGVDADCDDDDDSESSPRTFKKALKTLKK